MRPLPRVIKPVLFLLVPVLLGAELLMLVVRQWPYAVPENPEALHAKAAAVLDSKCARCHATPSSSPRARSVRSFDLAGWDEVPGLWNKLDVVLEGRGALMPPLRVRLACWGSWLSSSDRALLCAEVAVRRRAYFGERGLSTDGRVNLISLPPGLSRNQGRAFIGRDLFQDRRLSGDGTFACASCHHLNEGGADGRPRSIGVQGRMGAYNTPSVYNAALSFRQFWDGRATNLADQLSGPLLGSDQMDGGSLTGIVSRLAGDARLAARFAANYETGLVGSNLVDAIVQYENTLLTPRNTFDRYLGGRTNALSTTALRGYALFREVTCDACHGGPALGGLSLEYPSRDAAVRFKVPSLRNVGQTAPYWHDGSMTNLAEVVRCMGNLRRRQFTGMETADLVELLRTF